MALTFELNDDTGLFEATDAAGRLYRQFKKDHFHCTLPDGREAYGITAKEARHKAESLPVRIRFDLHGAHGKAISLIAKGEGKTPSRFVEDYIRVMLERSRVSVFEDLFAV